MSESLINYKRFVDTRLTQLSNKLKSQLVASNFTKFEDAVDILRSFYSSSEIKQCKLDLEELEKNLNYDEKLMAAAYSQKQGIQLLSDDIDIFGKKQILLNIFGTKIAELKQNPPRPSTQSRVYDQVVKGNVKIIEIKNNNEYSHKITFNKIGKFLRYQVWDSTGNVQLAYLPKHPDIRAPRTSDEANSYIESNPDKVVVVDYPINDDRDVVIKNAKEWVALYNSQTGFTPTTVIEIGCKKYTVVIKKAKINKNDKVVFYISTKEIHVDNKSDKLKALKKIPKGEYKNVRFDIDGYSNSIGCLGGTCSCPPGSNISTVQNEGLVVEYIQLCISTCPSDCTNVADVCWCSTYYGCNDCKNVLGCCWGGYWDMTACDDPECAGDKVTSFPPETFDCTSNACLGN